MEPEPFADIPADWITSGDGQSRSTVDGVSNAARKNGPAKQPERDPAKPRHVVIAGGGIMGCCTAYYLTQHANWRVGVDTVTVVEACDIAGAASGKAGGFLAKDWHQKNTTSLARLSYQLHEDLAKQHNGELYWGYRKIETYSVSLDTTSKKKGKTVPGVDWLSTNHVTQFSKLGAEGHTAQVTPRFFSVRISELAQARGAQMVNATVTGASFNREGEAHVESIAILNREGQQATLPCTDLIIAAGPWSGQLASRILPADLGLRDIPIVGQRAHSIIIQAHGRLTAHAVFSRLYDKGGMKDPEIYARPDGTAYACGSTDDEALPPSAFEVQVDVPKCDELYSQVSTISPQLKEGSVMARQACYLPMSETGSPLLGPVGAGVWANCGASCWGITLGTGAGLCLSEMMLEGHAKSADISKLYP